MIQLTAIVDGKPCTMLTESSIEEAAQSCRDRFGARFEGFAPTGAQRKRVVEQDDEHDVPARTDP